jgi:hypothetical protein
MNSATSLEIPKARWREFFESLGKDQWGWAVTVEVLSVPLGDQPAVSGLPLQGISYEVAGSQAGDILVEAGDAGTPFQTHLIHRPTVVRTATTQPGDEVEVEVETADGFTHLITIRRRPELPPANEK